MRFDEGDETSSLIPNLFPEGEGSLTTRWRGFFDTASRYPDCCIVVPAQAGTQRLCSERSDDSLEHLHLDLLAGRHVADRGAEDDEAVGLRHR